MSVKMKVDFSGATDAIGSALGWCDGVADDDYIDGLIHAAHSVATAEFDLDAAATAVVGNMTHVYEFGTRGITRGDARFPDPTSPEARLWVHNLMGTGRVQNISYVFRPAVAPNPRPSAGFYGVPSKVIARLSRRKYVFRNKASITEFGETVYIKPKDKPFNFVPFYGKPARNPEYSKGYVFRYIEGKQPMESNPGEDSGMKGTFTAFWTLWWQTRGEEIMSGTAEKSVMADMTWALERPPSAGGLQSPFTFNSRGRVYNRRRKIKKRMIQQAKIRGKYRRT